MTREAAASFTTDHWGALASTNPVSDQFGIDRGTPIDRIFIDTFISQHSNLVRGQVLEIGDDLYSRRYMGGDVTAISIVDVDPDNGSATLVADLARRGSLPLERYNCAIVTQTLQYVADLEAAVDNLYDCLVCGGALLATVPGITRVDPGDGRAADRWRFTPRGLFDLLARVFATDDIACVGYGDLHTATAFLYGLAAQDIGLTSGARRTSDFPVVVCARAVRR